MSIKKHKVLVLMAVKDGSLYIEQQIDSILNQNNVNCHILINFDSCSDNSYDIIKNKYCKNSKVLINRFVNFSSSSATFFDLILSSFKSYDFYSFSDQDDIWFEDKIFNAIKFLSPKKNDCYSSDVISWNQNKKIFVKRYLKKSYKIQKFDHFFESAGPGCTFVMSKNFFYSLQIFIKKNIIKLKKIDRHDWLIYSYAKENNWNWHIDNKAFILYRQHDLNYAGANLGLKAFVVRIKKLLSNEWFIQCKLIIKLTLNKNKILEPLLIKNNKLNYIFFVKNFYFCRRKFIEKFLFLFLMLFKIFYRK